MPSMVQGAAREEKAGLDSIVDWRHVEHKPALLM